MRASVNLEGQTVLHLARVLSLNECRYNKKMILVVERIVIEKKSTAQRGNRLGSMSDSRSLSSYLIWCVRWHCNVHAPFHVSDVLWSGRLKHLYCKSTLLGDHGAAQIARCLIVSAGSASGLSRPGQRGIALTLKSLWLEQNEIHDDGAAALSAAVAGAFPLLSTF